MPTRLQEVSQRIEEICARLRSSREREDDTEMDARGGPDGAETAPPASGQDMSSDDTAISDGAQPVPAVPANGQGLGRAILAYLEAHPGPQRAVDVIHALSLSPRLNERAFSFLETFADARKIRRMRPGVYAARPRASRRSQPSIGRPEGWGAPPRRDE